MASSGSGNGNGRRRPAVGEPPPRSEGFELARVRDPHGGSVEVYVRTGRFGRMALTGAQKQALGVVEALRDGGGPAGGAALDPAKIRVDGGGRPDAGELRIDRALWCERMLARITATLGPETRNLFDSVVCGGVSLEDWSRRRGMNAKHAAGQLRALADTAAAQLGLV